MNALWTTLVPLAIASAALPLQIAVTILLAQGRAGRVSALAWTTAMLVVRIGQGIVFGFVLGQGVAEAEGPDRPGPIASTLMLVVGVLLLASAIGGWLKEPDDDAPPPRWMAARNAVTPGRAALAGAGVVLASPKLWVFTLAALGAIAEAGLDPTGSVATYLVFTLAALSVHIAVVGLAYLWPAQATAILGRLSGALERHGRPLKIGLGLAFGAWFLAKSLAGLGIL